MSANLGSVATLVGNPQNMIIGSLSGLSFTGFSRSLLPAAGLGLAIEYAVLRFGFRAQLDAAVIADALPESAPTSAEAAAETVAPDPTLPPVSPPPARKR